MVKEAPVFILKEEYTPKDENIGLYGLKQGASQESIDSYNEFYKGLVKDPFNPTKEDADRVEEDFLRQLDEIEEEEKKFMEDYTKSHMDKLMGVSSQQ